MNPRPFFCALSLCALLALNGSARAVILLGTGDTSVNTTAPTGDLAGSGWQYEGQFSAFLGTAIAPNYFITAAHIGGAALVGYSFLYNGASYTTTAAYTQPGSDLCIYKVDGTFSSYAPLFTTPGGELHQDLVVFGRGTQRGNEVTLSNGQPGGWAWGGNDTPSGNYERWGTNNVAGIVADSRYGSLLNATFDQGAGYNEAHLSSGDSGGAVFIRDVADGVWKLAGINLGVDGPFYATNDGTSSPLYAAMYDTTGLYEKTGSGAYLAAPNPSGFYSTEVAADLDFIYTVIPEPSSALLPILGALGLAGLRRDRRAR